ncbi:MAG: DUF11 domain-containing protein [Saprospiraceae bacterium]|nr:DUF11 domain-containing protein [Saprospiraceae bacterium]
MKNQLTHKNKFYRSLRFLCFITVMMMGGLQSSKAQCGFGPGEGCSNTDYTNAFSTSTTDRNTIEYDNFVLSFHSTIVRTDAGTFKFLGEYMANHGSTNQLSPVEVNSANYPNLTGTPLKATLGSNFFQNVQGIMLTSTGIFAWGDEGIVVANSLTTSTTFDDFAVNGQADGLPAGINSEDVKMITATYQTLAIVTCSGSVYVLSQQADLRGNGATGNSTTWYQVTTSASGNPALSGIVACRVSNGVAMALGSDGSIWTWGTRTYLGNGTAIAARNRATQMTLPAYNSGASAKMISLTAPQNPALPSYYILATDNNLYAMGENTLRQLGDWTTTDRTSWVQPRYTSSAGPVMNDIQWIAANENDSGPSTYGAINVLTTGSQVYNWGENNTSLLGRTGDPVNPGTPAGIAPTDVIIALETGGHTSMYVKQCELNFGYVGHRINGSMGNGSAGSATETSVTYATAEVAICAADATPVIELSVFGSGSGGAYCTTQSATVTATPSGGTLSVQSGPGTLLGNVLTFTGPGQVILKYALSPPCGGISEVFDTITSVVCVKAVTESGTVISAIGGTALSNIASNDTINGVSATLGGGGNATVAQSGSWPSGISLNTTTGAVTVTPGTAAGSYPVTYQLCDKLVPPNCVTMVDTVHVLATVSTLTVVKTQTSGPNPVTTAGQVLGYTIVLTNTGNIPQTGVTTTDVLPNGSNGTLSGPTESISVNGILNVGETWTYTISYVITQSDIDAGGNLVNTVSVVTTEVPGPTTDNETTPIDQNPSLTVSKTQTSGPNPVTAAGQVIGYTIVVTNTGNQTLTNAGITDILPDGSTGTMSGPVESLSSNGEINVGETWTYTINYTVTQSDIDAGANLVNNVSVITDEVPGPTTDNETTPIDQNPSLMVVKSQTSGPNPVTAAGQVIGYTIVVTNTGNQTLTNAGITDILPDGSTGTLSGPVESLSNNGEINVGETWTYTINYTVTQSDIDAGANLVNNVSVITDEVPGPTTDTETTPIDQNPSLTVSKTQTSGPNPVTAAGQVIGYTIVVTNTGNQTLTNAGITDILPDGSTGTMSGPVESLSSNGEINVGETWTYTINYTVTQSDIDAGANLVNNVSVTTDEVPGPTTDNETTLVDQNPSLTVSKTQTSGPSPVTAAGQVIGYTIVVTNTGNQTLTNAGITDILPDGSTGTLSGPVESLSSNGEINVGETWTYTINYTVTQSDIDAGANLVNNVSVITDEVPGPTTDNETTLVDQNPSLTVSKTQTSGPNPVTAAGQVIGYTIVVTNTGNQTLTNAGITDILPDGSTGTMSGPVESLSSNGEINVGETWTYTINYTVTQSDIDAGANLVNNVSVTTDEVPGPTTDTETTPIDQNPSLTVSKTQTSGPSPVTAAGQVIGYTIVVTNTGNQTLTNAGITDILPDGSTGTMSGPVESLSNNGEINVGETWTYTINYTVTQSDIDVGTNLVNNVSVTTDEVPGPTTDTETTPIDQNPSLTVSKTQTSGPNPVSGAGQVIGYSIVVTNTGNQTLTNVSATDILPDGSTGTLSGPVESLSSNGEINVGETWTYTINYTVTQSDIDAGANLVNNVSVITDEVPGPTTDTETTPIDQNPSLTVSKTQTSGPSPVTAAGQVIGYTIVVTNTGNQTLTNAGITDILPDGSTGTMSGPVESLSNNGEINVGETWTYTINYTVTQSDIDAGANLVNNVSVITDEVPGPTTANETTPIDQNPSLTVSKTQTSGPNPVTAAGQVIGYTIVVTNTGNQTLTNAGITDILPDGSTGTLSGPVESLSSNGEINVGETWTYTINYTVTQSDIDAGANLVNNVSVITDEVPGPTTDNETTLVDQNPSLTVSKIQTSGPNPVTAAGQVIGYTIVVTNTGNQTLTNAGITDILPDGSTGTLSGPVESLSNNGEINVGETWTYTINYTVTQSDIDAGANLVNNVSVTTDEVPGPTTDNETTLVDQNPSLIVIKTQTSGPNPVTAAGQVIGYTIVVTNTGNQTLTNAGITDILPDGSTGTLSGPVESLSSNGEINVGETWTYTINYTVTQSDIDAGSNLVNNVSVTTDEVPGPILDDASTPIGQSVALTVSKTQTSGPNPVTGAGQVIGYTIVVTNTGNQTLTNVSATDILPDGSTGTMSGPVESLSSNGEINVGETWTYTINYTVTQSDIDAGANLVNNVSVITDEVPGPTTDNETTLVDQNPSLTVSKTQTSGPNPVSGAGQVIGYTIVVTNTGNQTLTNAGITDILPDGSTGTMSGPVESLSNNGEINVGETWTYTINYTVTQSDIDAGANLVNNVSVTTDEVPGPTTDNETTLVDQNPSLTVSKTQTSGPNPVTAAGQVIGYTIVVTNTGNQTLTNAGITDILPDGSTGTMSGPVESLSSNGEINVGETWTYTINYTVTQSDIDAGANLVNNVSATTDEVPGPTTDTETTPIDQNPSLTVSKTQTSGPNPVSGAGQVIGYTIG